MLGKQLHSIILLSDEAFELLILSFPDQICHSPHFQPDNSCDVSPENLVLDQLIIPNGYFFFILVTYLVDIVRKNYLLKDLSFSCQLHTGCIGTSLILAVCKTSVTCEPSLAGVSITFFISGCQCCKRLLCH